MSELRTLALQRWQDGPEDETVVDAMCDLAERVFKATQEAAAKANCPLCQMVGDPDAPFVVDPVKDGMHHVNAEWGWDKPCASVEIRALTLADIQKGVEDGR